MSSGTVNFPTILVTVTCNPRRCVRTPLSGRERKDFSEQPPRKFIRSTDRAKSGVLVRASRPILLPDIIGGSSSETRARKALFRFVPVLHFLLIEKKGDFSYLESFCGVLCLLFFRTFFSLPRDRSAKRERARRRKGQRLQPNGNEQGRNDKMRRPGHPHLERRAEVFGPVALPVPPESGGACVGGAPPEIGLEALTLLS
ncbi:unnamed protein product [Lactuca saligna]|uniref:Uncharacterized protein n=1 Tax=Lactuca saligna TaxID=75948 RepID=A0AA35YZC1_LACSI|nr:unnamed protein product [Lactuca saligna]